LEEKLDIISYFETFINSKTFLNKTIIDAKLKQLTKEYFKDIIKIKMMELPYGGWEIKAVGLKSQWVKAYIIEEGFVFKIYWYNSNEFLRWVATVIMHEIASEYNAGVFSGQNLEVIKPEKAWFKTFKEYTKSIDYDRIKDLPPKIKKKFEIK